MIINYNYFLVTLITFLYLCYKFRNDLISFIIIILFYSGMFAGLGKGIENPYKIISLCLTIYAAFKLNVFNFRGKKEFWIAVFFMLFTISFVISAFVGNNYAILVLSQYAKYLIPFCFFFIFRHYFMYSSWKLKRMNSLFFLC